jgi:hypothetical protein
VRAFRDYFFGLQVRACRLNNSLFLDRNLLCPSSFVIRTFAFSVLLFCLGCNRSHDTVRVTGQLMKDGKPYTANLGGKEPETFVVDFVGTRKDHNYLYNATINSDGSFRVNGADGRGIPKGPYKITVLHSGFLGAGGDRLGTKYAVEKTPLAIDLSKNAKLTIDLGAGTVSE